MNKLNGCFNLVRWISDHSVYTIQYTTKIIQDYTVTGPYVEGGAVCPPTRKNIAYGHGYMGVFGLVCFRKTEIGEISCLVIREILISLQIPESSTRTLQLRSIS